MKIALGSDHAGFRYKEKIKELLISLGHEVRDFGTSSEAPVDYPRFIRPAAEAVAKGECDRAIVLGGSGNGEAIAANKVPGIRCALRGRPARCADCPTRVSRKLLGNRRPHGQKKDRADKRVALEKGPIYSGKVELGRAAMLVDQCSGDQRQTAKVDGGQGGNESEGKQGEKHGKVQNLREPHRALDPETHDQ